MDVFYLSIAYLSTLRNWESMPAFRIGWFLYFYRLVGALVFELTHARWVLLVFPNVFEYFFIAYETVRSRWQPVHLLVGWWLSAAALIWVVVKLPQEYWLHVAQLDVTDEIGAAPLDPRPAHRGAARPRPGLPEARASPAVAAGLVLDASGPRRFPRRSTSPRSRRRGGCASTRSSPPAPSRRSCSLGLVSVIFSQMLPGLHRVDHDVFIGVAAVVVINSGITLAAARRRWTIRSTALAFAARLAMNIVLVLIADPLLGRHNARLDGYDTLFFLTLISLITTLHDRWRPVHEVREVLARGEPAPELERRAGLSGLSRPGAP